MTMSSNYLTHVDLTKVSSNYIKRHQPEKLSDAELRQEILRSKQEENKLRLSKKKMIDARANGQVGQQAVKIADKNLLQQIERTKMLEEELNKRQAKHYNDSEDYLAHHGRLGMRWGKRNGPPYPLDFKDLSPEEKQKAKDESIRKGDIQTAYKNRDHYTDQELKSVKDRFKLNQEVAAIDRSLIKTGSDKVESLINSVDRIMKNVDKVGNAYNIGRKVAITFGMDPNEIPKYGDGNNNNDKNNKNKG